MDIISIIKEECQNIVESRVRVNWDNLPEILYHVTTNKDAVLSSKTLLAKKGLDSGGLGGTESNGVSFVSDINIAKAIYNELNLLNNINSSRNEDEVLSILGSIDDDIRKDIVVNEYHRTREVYNDPITTALMALRLSRNSSKTSGKPYNGLIIFNEKNIKDKSIGIIKISKNSIPKDVEIIEGVDKHLGEVRVLSDIKL